MMAPPLFPDLETPALLIDRSVLRDNIERMQALADKHNLALRPHIKTHKIIEIARMQTAAGAVGLAVAKLGEAETMAEAGCTDIQVANQVVGPLKLERLRRLHERIRISCAIDSSDHLRELATVFNDDKKPLRVFIELDSGLHRCGVSTTTDALALARQLDQAVGLRLAGVLTHAGHAYAVEEIAALGPIGRREGELAVAAAQAIREAGLSVEEVSVGSTPTVAYAATVPGVTEIRPGNYVFNDMMQVSLGVATPDRCALSVLATVISCPTRERAVIDAGSKALSLDRGAHGNARLVGFGHAVNAANVQVERLSEEHGMIAVGEESIAVGDRLRIIPNHACAVTNLFDSATVVENGSAVGEWRIAARGRST